MKPLSSSNSSKLNIQPIRKSSGTLSQTSKRSSVLIENLQSLKIEQRDFNDKVEDNIMRRQKIDTLLKEFEACNAAIETPSANMASNSKLRLVTESITLAEKLLGYLNIDITLVNHPTNDAAITIDPIKGFDNLFMVLKYLVPRLASFPYTFLSQIKLRNLQFCADIHKGKPQHMEIYKQKVWNGLFPVNRLKGDDKKILKHLCRILMYNLYKNAPGFGNDWKNFTEDMNSLGQQDENGQTTGWKNVYEDLAEVFYTVLRINEGKKPSSNPDMEIKVAELRRRLKEFDPAGINYEWFVCKDENQEERDKENSLFLTSNQAINHKW